MAAPAVRHPQLLARDATVFVVIDLQEGYRSVLFEYERVATAVACLVQGAVALGVPLVVTEQYPQGIGSTVKEVARYFPQGLPVIEKMSMSCCGVEAFMSALDDLGRHQVLLAGIETHACVNQTAHDLIAAGYQVHVARDATSARRREDDEIGWLKMLWAGMLPATVESALFELVRTADAPEFKAVQRLIK
ncbi:MAG: isochorismatase family protein [Myxococcales bacterium]|jgi:nicotinamidase-related amidase|nr:isochorismatase family protein [Myxococcales bacterium]